MNYRQRITGSAAMNYLWALAAIAVVAVIVGGTFWLGEPANSNQVDDSADVIVYKNQYCGCCHKWVEHLRDSGLTVAVHNVDSTQAVRSKLGVPDSMASCHTAVAGDYWLEGHVPADLVQRLIDESPANIEGIAVPGMPAGSPGMEGPNPGSYDVVAMASDGSAYVFATRDGEADGHE